MFETIEICIDSDPIENSDGWRESGRGRSSPALAWFRSIGLWWEKKENVCSQMKEKGKDET